MKHILEENFSCKELAIQQRKQAECPCSQERIAASVKKLYSYFSLSIRNGEITMYHTHDHHSPSFFLRFRLSLSVCSLYWLLRTSVRKIDNLPPSPSSGSRRRKQHPARTLLNRRQAGKWQVLTFATNFAVPFDNNQAERDLRMLKVQQKVSGGLRTEMGIQVLCRIRSYLSTLRKQRGDLLQDMHYTLLGDPVLPAF
jgi:transposase IS66 family protein